MRRKKSSKITEIKRTDFSRMPCGEGLFFLDDIPFFDDVFPIIDEDIPKTVIAMVRLQLTYDADGEPEWNIDFYHTANVKIMKKNVIISLWILKFQLQPISHL